MIGFTTLVTYTHSHTYSHWWKRLQIDYKIILRPRYILTYSQHCLLKYK